MFTLSLDKFYKFSHHIFFPKWKYIKVWLMNRTGSLDCSPTVPHWGWPRCDWLVEWNKSKALSFKSKQTSIIGLWSPFEFVCSAALKFSTGHRWKASLLWPLAASDNKVWHGYVELRADGVDFLHFTLLKVRTPCYKAKSVSSTLSEPVPSEMSEIECWFSTGFHKTGAVLSSEIKTGSWCLRWELMGIHCSTTYLSL